MRMGLVLSVVVGPRNPLLVAVLFRNNIARAVTQQTN